MLVIVRFVATVMLKLWTALPPEPSATWILNVKEPALVGRPEMVPVEASSPRPGGSDPLATDQV